jgi:hypothetical protein
MRTNGFNFGAEIDAIRNFTIRGTAEKLRVGRTRAAPGWIS